MLPMSSMLVIFVPRLLHPKPTIFQQALSMLRRQPADTRITVLKILGLLSTPALQLMELTQTPILFPLLHPDVACGIFECDTTAATSLYINHHMMDYQTVRSNRWQWLQAAESKATNRRTATMYTALLTLHLTAVPICASPTTHPMQLVLVL